ncbi:unnamed protein product [Linum trigynum]|uniref:Uncharacterized protein n=1 Tax=Linum trigynum TaxID=586398 RepID=A0AAV2FQX0_9ROSI
MVCNPSIPTSACLGLHGLGPTFTQISVTHFDDPMYTNIALPRVACLGLHAEMASSDTHQEQPRSENRRSDRSAAYSTQLADGNSAGISAAKIEE